MPQMPTREQLRTEFDAATHDLQNVRPTQNLTNGFAAKIGDSVFDAGYRALADGSAAVETQGDPGQPRRPRLHVVSAPVGSGKTSFTIALITACVRWCLNQHRLATTGDTDATKAPSRAACPTVPCVPPFPSHGPLSHRSLGQRMLWRSRFG